MNEKRKKQTEWLHCWMALGMNYVLVPACRPEAGGTCADLAPSVDTLGQMSGVKV